MMTPDRLRSIAVMNREAAKTEGDRETRRLLRDLARHWEDLAARIESGEVID